MNLLQAIILGIIQGLTEFLPVSSSGHLLLAQRLFGLTNSSLVFEVAVHLGTLVPVFYFFWGDIVALIKKPFQKITYLLIVATIPAIIAVKLLGDNIDALFNATYLISISFIVTGLVLMYSDRVKDGWKKDRNVSYVDAAVIGAVQAVAITPGISRSGSTICGSLFRGLSRETAAKFSFLMSIPAILGAAVLQIIKIAQGEIAVADLNVINLCGGFVASMLAGFLAIGFMLALIKKCKLKYFSFYVFALAAFILADKFLLGGMFLG